MTYRYSTLDSELFIDGVSQGVVNGYTMGTGTTSTFRIGGTTDGSDDYKGFIDDFRIYDMVLSDDEISEIQVGDL